MIIKSNAIKILTSFIQNIEEIKLSKFNSVEFKKWEFSLLAALKNIFFENHLYLLKAEELLEIKRDVFYYFSEVEIQSLHAKNLDEVKFLLLSIIEEINLYWNDDDLFLLNLKDGTLTDNKKNLIKLPEEVIDLIKKSL